MDLTVATEEYASDVASHTVWERLRDALGSRDGIAFYSHPILAEAGRRPPELSVLAEGLHPIIVRVLNLTIDEVVRLDHDIIEVGEKTKDSPFLELDDFAESLAHKFNRHRDVRRVFEPVLVFAMPNVARADFEKRFELPVGVVGVWSDLNVQPCLRAIKEPPKGEVWRLSKAIFQTATPIKGDYTLTLVKQEKIGDAIAALRKRVALLDKKQLRVAVEVPPGPQRIRGLAGTGKTVLLAMRAAFIHLRNPEATILFTFYTRSLYQMVRDLIGRFYRDHVGHEPDWDKLHVRHAWGARDEPGVYSDWSSRTGTSRLDFKTAQASDYQSPLRACAKHALSAPGGIDAIYDYVLVDESQDLPAEFMQFLYRLSKEPHRIYFAQDAMQNLGTLEVATAEEIFGKNKEGQPVVRLDVTYPGGIEADFVLDTAYRCTLSTLMLAHGLGLGVYRTGGPVQMIFSADDWRTIGYEKTQGTFKPGEIVKVCRGTKTTPTVLSELYSGQAGEIEVKVCHGEKEEVDWIGDQIAGLVKNERVRPEDIMVVALDAIHIRQFTAALQAKLQEVGLRAQQAGATYGASSFAAVDSVTISSTYRAKGNEAPIVFMAQMQQLYSYAEERTVRNLVFTAVSRSMGWVRLSGFGPLSGRALKEAGEIRKRVPCFEFKMPSPAQVRKVDAEITRQRREREKANLVVSDLKSIDDEALASLPPSEIERLIDKLRRAQREDK
jgi:superfamily I DNA and RNA helicase